MAHFSTLKELSRCEAKEWKAKKYSFDSGKKMSKRIRFKTQKDKLKVLQTTESAKL